MLATYNFPRPPGYLGRELSFVCTLTDLPPLWPPLMQAIHIGLSTIREKEPETQHDTSSSVIRQNKTDVNRSFVEDNLDCQRSNVLGEEPLEDREVVCTDSRSESGVSEPQSECDMAESCSRDTMTPVKEVASNGYSDYSMLAVRGRHRVGMALATGIWADEEAKIVWPEGFACMPEDCGEKYEGKYKGITEPGWGTISKSTAYTGV
ncbi:hypothetical protein C8Q72DRAFT_821971 [Fomitopsis betulina]|nr:hypothetical protein C8Q72DRAFT_821971 [Fomitopsis betulina]